MKYVSLVGFNTPWALKVLPTSCGSASKESACNVGDLGLIPRLERSPGEGKGYPLQYSGLENSKTELPFTARTFNKRDKFTNQNVTWKYFRSTQLWKNSKHIKSFSYFSFFILKCFNTPSDSHPFWGLHSPVLALLLTSCLILFILPKLNFVVKWGYEHVNHLADRKIKQANVCRVFTWHISSTDSKAVPVEDITCKDKESLELLMSIHLPGGRHPPHRGSNKGHAAIQCPLDHLR